ncbi:MAG: hypothetical protein V7K89_25770 [Nostoc sp.]|uniref:hypothetical protein n=1 Tax=Nostoc sp. TaxID=1180 RepID=UPI002FFAB6E0
MSLNLPAGIAGIIKLFSRFFSTRVQKQAEVLMIGAILTTRKRTVSSILEIIKIAHEKNFQNGQGKRQVQICSDTAVWYHTAKPVVPIFWVLIRDTKGQFETQPTLSTGLAYSPIQILEWFVCR